MIEISHTQARRLVSAQIDELNLPDEQWTGLHAHLENCPECTAFRQQVRQRERDIRRGLRGRWQTVDGPNPATGEIVLAARGAAQAWRVAFRKAGAGALGLALLVMAWMGWQSQSENRQQSFAPVVSTATPVPTPTATPIPTYRGQIIYTAPGVKGKADIFLLNSGVEPVNLTEDPAEDISPAWSPDGEWLAFFSDRSGKQEIWVMHVSGASLTQITDDPVVKWWGPISWSPDGKMLALLGYTGYGEFNNIKASGFIAITEVYLIPLDGSSGPIALGNTVGASSVAFAPGKERKLAFAGQSEWNGAPVVYHMGEKSFTPVDSPYFSNSERHVISIAWSLTGERLLYQVDGPYQFGVPDETVASALRVSDFKRNSSGQLTALPKFLSENRPQGVVSSPGWTGIRDEYAFLMDYPPGCKRLVLNSTNPVLMPNFSPDNNNLCVEGPLPLTNWRTADKSVIAKARRPGESVPGMYVFQFAGKFISTERLIDLDDSAASVQLRPQGHDTVLAIDPTPARTPPQPPPGVPPGDDYAEIIFTTTSFGRMFIEAIRPDGSGRRLVNQSEGYNGCPVWSPDRKQIAFYSNRDGETGNRTKLYLMDASGMNPRLVNPNATGTPAICPKWSSDGGKILVTSSNSAYIVEANSETSQNAQFWIDSDILGPMWLPDGQVLAFEREHETGMFSARSGIVPPATHFWPADLFASWPEIFSTTVPLYAPLVDISENGGSIMYAGIEPGMENAGLYLINLKSGNHTGLGPLVSGQNLFPLPYALRRVTTDQVILVYRGYVDSQFKTAVYIYDLQSGEQRWLARLTDALIEAHWSADGRYVLLNTEAGLWALDIPAAVKGEAGPVYIADIGSEPFSWEE